MSGLFRFVLMIGILSVLMACSSGGSSPQPGNPGNGNGSGNGGGGDGGGSNVTLNLLSQLEPLGLNGVPPIGGDPGDEIYMGISSWAAEDGTEYALLANSRGLAVIDVTVPEAPVFLYLIPLDGGGLHRDVEVYQHYAYVGGQEDAATQIVDLSSLPDEPPVVHEITPSVNFSHTLNIARDMLFLNSANGNCRVYSLDNPILPGLIADYTGDDCHDSFVRDDLFVSAGGYQGVFVLFDISDPINRVKLGSTPVETGLYAHSAWTTEDNNILFGFDESDYNDITIYDIRDKTNPVEIATFDMPGNTLMHNGRSEGDYLYLAYYESGFVIVDVSDPVSPELVAQHLTWPNGGSGFFNGAWNLNMDLPSGNILVSDTASGLFIFNFSGRQQPQN